MVLFSETLLRKDIRLQNSGVKDKSLRFVKALYGELEVVPHAGIQASYRLIFESFERRDPEFGRGNLDLLQC